MVSALKFDRAVPVRVLTEGIATCSWARQVTLAVPLPPIVCNCVPVNLMQGITLRWTSIPGGLATYPGGNTPGRYMLRNL